MEEQVEKGLRSLQTSDPTSSIWQEFSNNLTNPEFLNSLFNIVLSDKFSYQSRILGIAALIKFEINIDPQMIPHFFYLLSDEQFQKIIAQYIVLSSNHQFLCKDVFPSFYQQIQNQELINPFIGLILCFYEFVRIRQIRDETIIQIIYQILVNREDLPIEYKKMALETIILQINFTPFTKPELIKQDEKNILTLLLSYPVNENNFPMFEYLLFFINKHILDVLEIEGSSEALFRKNSEILDTIISKCPLDPEDYVYTTTAYYLIDIFERMQIVIPFEKLFPILAIGQKQLNLLENSAYAFYAKFIGDSDFYTDEDNTPPDERIDPRDFIDNIETLNDLQNRVMLYHCCLPNDIKDEILRYDLNFCFSVMNQSLLTNFAIIRFFICASVQMYNYAFPFDPKQFECFDHPILLYSLLDFCQLIVEYQGKSQNIFYSFLCEFNLKTYIGTMINSNNPVLTLCAFSLAIRTPRELIDPDIYAALFCKTLPVILQLNAGDNRIELIDELMSMYISKDSIFSVSNINAYENNDPNIRRFLSSSIFFFNDSVVSAFKQEAANLFGNILPHLFSYLRYEFKTIQKFAEIFQFFAGGDIKQYVSRFRKDEFIVNMSNYCLFFPEICQNISQLCMLFFSDQEFIDCGFSIFAMAFSNIYYPEDPNYIEFINFVYQMYYNDYKIICNLKVDIIDSILKIFIKNGKLEKLDDFCFVLCNQDDYNLIQSFIYEFSFVIINKYNVYPNEMVISIVKKLLRIFYNSVMKKESNNNINEEEEEEDYGDGRWIMCGLYIGIIFARVALSLGKDAIQMLITSLRISKEKNEVYIFLRLLYESIQEKYFSQSDELHQKLIILLYFLLSDHKGAIQMAQILLYKMVVKLKENFQNKKKQNPDKPSSTFALIRESIFYDDLDFLAHPLMCMSVCDLIQVIVKQPMNQKFGETFENFIKEFPNL